MGYKYKTNHDYFSSIDTEEKAYFLGLFYADGNIQPSNGNRQGRITISLQESDGYILKNFKNLVNKDIEIQNPPSSSTKGWSKRAILRVTSNKIVEDLINIGCNVNKSRVGMTFPELDESLVHHFIRGFLDGDGCISLHKSSGTKLRITFTCTSKEFLEKLASYLPVTKYSFRSKFRTLEIFDLQIERSGDIRLLLPYIYKDSTIYLERKRNKIDEYNMLIKSEVKRIRLKRLETT